MPRRDVTWSTALCASLAAHAALVGGAAEWYARGTGTSIYLPGHPPDAVGGDVIVVTPDADGPDRRTAEFGEADAEGYAANSSAGRESQRAREADQDQALLSRDPVGPGRIGDEPSFSLVPPGMASSGGGGADDDPDRPISPRQPRLVAILPAATDDSHPIGIGPGTDDLRTPTTRPKLPAALALVTPAAPEPLPAQPQPTESTEAEPARSSGLPGGATAAADPAPMSESESDPFSTLGGVEFRGGKMEARFGRRFKSVRPRLNDAAQLDLLGLRLPRMVLKVVTDETGKVTKVDVLKSTGSSQVDQPMTVAMYQWWFEPPTGKDGKPVGDVIVFPISWR